MPQKIIELRTRDQRHIDLDCSDLLDAAETITSVGQIMDDAGVLVFGAGAVNASPTTYKDGRVVPAGKVIQVLVSGAVVATGEKATLYTARALLVTSRDPAVDATFELLATDRPGARA